MCYNFGNMLRAKTNFKIYHIIFKFWLTLQHFAMDDPAAQKENAQDNTNTYCMHTIPRFFTTFLPFFSYMVYVF
jgi:hypothetical protein